jgi:N-acetylglucosaminyl-diphospho-decaprenol L-rhamnosyltransferase
MTSRLQPRTRRPRTAVLTLAHQRHQHLLHQVDGLSLGTVPPDLHVVVAMGDRDLARRRLPITTDRWDTVVPSLPVSRWGLPLAAARNLAAQVALREGAEVLVFLDVDCIPGRRLVQTYAEATTTTRRPAPALWCGDVAYLRRPPAGGYPVAGDLEALATRKADRPVLRTGEAMPERRFERFWSLSFAMSAADYRLTGGFCKDYVGYGGEDTDFAQVVRKTGGSLTWVGGATAYHQHHESGTPPVQHLDAILRNAAVFHDRWGWWPMEGWLEEFERRGLVRTDAAGRWVKAS